MVGGYRRPAPARRLAPAAPGAGRRKPQPGRCRRQGTAVRVAHRPEQDRGRRRPLREARGDRRPLGPDLVRPGHVPRRLGTLHDHRGRGQPLGGRRGRRRGQSQVHLGRDLRRSGSGTPARPSCSTGRDASSPIRTSAWCCAPTKPRSDRSRPCAPPFSPGPARRPPARTLRARRCWRRWRRSPASTGASSSSSRSPRPSGRSTPRCGAPAALLVAGAVLAAVLAYWLTQRMIGPIRLLEDGVARIGAGQFDHRISLATGDEFERLADPLQRDGRRAVGFAGALGAHQPAQALSRAAGGRTGRPHRRRPRARRAARRGGRGVLRPARLHRLLGATPSPRPSSACCANTTTRWKGW